MDKKRFYVTPYLLEVDDICNDGDVSTVYYVDNVSLPEEAALAYRERFEYDEERESLRLFVYDGKDWWSVGTERRVVFSYISVEKGIVVRPREK